MLTLSVCFSFDSLKNDKLKPESYYVRVDEKRQCTYCSAWLYSAYFVVWMYEACNKVYFVVYSVYLVVYRVFYVAGIYRCFRGVNYRSIKQNPFYTQRNLFEILLWQTKIRLYLPFFDWCGTKRTSVWFKINRCMVNTIWFRFDLTRFGKYFSMYIA